MWAKAGAGIFPGFFLSAGLVGLLCWLPPGRWESAMVPSVLAFFPLWVGVICAAFRFKRAAHAWAWLAALAIVALGMLQVFQGMGWVR